MLCSLENYSVAYEKTQSNRVSDFCDFVCSMFPKAIRFDFYCQSWRFVFLLIIYIEMYKHVLTFCCVFIKRSFTDDLRCPNESKTIICNLELYHKS